MTVIVNIWRGKLPQFTVWNAIYGLNVGHASMLVIDDENPEDTIYISHRPQAVTNSSNSKAKLNKDTSKKYALGDIFTPKAKPISFDEDCERRVKKPGQIGKPNNQISISGLNEYQIREIYQQYLNNDLPESASQYHVRKNNCSTVVAYFIRQGLECPEKACNFCSAKSNQPDWKIQEFLLSAIFMRFVFGFSVPLIQKLGPKPWLVFGFIVIILLPFLIFVIFNLERDVIASNNKFWSPRTIEYFAKKVKKRTNKNHSKLCFNLRFIK